MSLFEELAKKYDTVFYPFFLEGVAAQAKFALRDGVHPNAAGVDAIVLGILPKAEELIARIRKRRGINSAQRSCAAAANPVNYRC